MHRPANLFLLAGVFGACMATTTHAATLTLYYGHEFSGAANPAGSAPWLQAEFDDGGASGAVTLTLTSLLQDLDEFVREVSFNVVDNDLAGLLPAAGGDAGSGTGAFVLPSISYGADAFKADGDGFFDLKVDFAVSGGASDRFGGSDVWTVTFVRDGLTVADFDDTSVDGPAGKTGFYSAAHIQGIDPTVCNEQPPETLAPELCDSGWIAGDPSFPPTEIPLPAAAWLFLTGLFPLAAFLRKRRETLWA
jgi:hypothetical protein